MLKFHGWKTRNHYKIIYADGILIYYYSYVLLIRYSSRSSYLKMLNYATLHILYILRVIGKYKISMHAMKIQIEHLKDAPKWTKTVRKFASYKTI